MYEDPEVKNEIPHVNILKESLENSAARPLLSYYSQLSEIIQRFVNNCLAGRIEPADALDKIQIEAEQLGKLYNE